LEHDKRVLTFGEPENEQLIALGALPVLDATGVTGVIAQLEAT
jgi:hypothetical protein